ncbi:MAG: M56 family metallopeptidase [Merdibacter sp.]
MTELFLAVLDRSVIGCYVILVILLIRILFRYSPKRFSYLLWMIAFLALILPIDLVSDFSVRPDLSSVTPSTIVERRQMEEAKQQVLVPSAPQQAPDVIQMEEPAAAEEVWTPDLEQIAAALWASGALALLAWNGLCAIRLRRQLRDARLLHENVYETEVSGAPFAVGLFRPRIYLPYGWTHRCRNVLAHEQIHVRRRDLWVKLAAYAVLCVH